MQVRTTPVLSRAQAVIRARKEAEKVQLRRVVDRFTRVTSQLPIDVSTALRLMTLVALEDLTQAITPVALPVYKTDFVNATAAGDTEVVERVVGKRIQVVAFTLNNGGGSVATVHFRSESRPISSDKDLAADGGGMVVASNPNFWFETAMGEALNINLVATGAVGVDVVYVEREGRAVKDG